MWNEHEYDEDDGDDDVEHNLVADSEVSSFQLIKHSWTTCGLLFLCPIVTFKAH